MSSSGLSFLWSELVVQFTFNKGVNSWKWSKYHILYKHVYRFKPAIVLVAIVVEMDIEQVAVV